MTEDFVLRVHDVRDILDLMPAIQQVGPRGPRTVPPETALNEVLLGGLDAHGRAVTTLRATDSGAVIVKAPERIQEQVADALHAYRLELVRRQVGDDFPTSRDVTPERLAR